MNKTGKFFYIFRFLAIFLAIALISLPPWLHQNFGKTVLFDNVLFHMLIGTDALVGADHQIIQSFINEVILLALGIALLVEFALFVLKKYEHKKLVYYICLLEKKSILAGIVLVATIDSGFSLGATQYVYQQAAGKDYFSTYYTKPGLVLNHNTKKKNLIILYVESLEQTLTNKKIFGTNLIEPIDELPGITVKKLVAAPGTGWTLAGMVASQCAIPLKTPPFTNKISRINFFLPNIVCIGDILASQGYNQYVFVGSDLNFAKENKFYKNHGYQHLYGLHEFANEGMSPSLFTGWGGGLNDDTVLDEAFKHIIKAAKSTQPFNVVIITSDNHTPNGIPSPRCRQTEKDNGFIGTYQCSSRFVAVFIKKLQNSGVLRDTALILMGDHPFMAKPEHTKYFPDPRYVYFKIIDPNFKKEPTRNTMTHFDVAPTILDLLNIHTSTAQRFGLGVSIFANKSQINYKKLFDAVTNQSILNPSKTYDSFWYPALIK